MIIKYKQTHKFLAENEHSTFRLDIENWGLGTYLYAYLLWWVTVVGLINLGVYVFSYYR